jgi:hypothetical protein
MVSSYSKEPFSAMTATQLEPIGHGSVLINHNNEPSPLKSELDWPQLIHAEIIGKKKEKENDEASFERLTLVL